MIIVVRTREAIVLSTDKLALLHKAVLDSCDVLDGIKDGVIDTPAACHFDPGKLLCKGTDRSACLTPPQVEAAEKIYSGPTNPRTGEQVFPASNQGANRGSLSFGVRLRHNRRLNEGN
jgi:feruloyl esterase